MWNTQTNVSMYVCMYVCYAYVWTPGITKAAALELKHFGVVVRGKLLVLTLHLCAHFSWGLLALCAVRKNKNK